MKKTRFSAEQMVKILREADTTPVSEVAKKHGVSDVTIYAWRKRFGQLEAVDVKRRRQLEAENARLKKVLAERVMDIEILKEVAAKKMVSAPARRQQIAYVCQRGRSVRRACALLSVARSTVGYQPRLAARDAPAAAVMHELAQYPRYGYRRIHVFMARRGHAMSTDRAHCSATIWVRGRVASELNAYSLPQLISYQTGRLTPQASGAPSSYDPHPETVIDCSMVVGS